MYVFMYVFMLLKEFYFVASLTEAIFQIRLVSSAISVSTREHQVETMDFALLRRYHSV